MSGTSLDGVSTALVRLTEQPLDAQLVAFRQDPYTAPERGQIIEAIARGGSQDLALLHVALGERFAGAVLQLLAQAKVAPRDLSFIASHGQTIWHEPGRATLQLGDPAVIAERVGVRVVSDFRSRDVAAGGQGAPLVPLADVMLFGHPERGRLLLNLGGMANVTWVPRRGTQVTFAMPPRLRSSRQRSGCPNSITSASGTRGAPCPPAATSRERKSLTTRTPTRSAITAGSPSCSVARPGSCQIVWPCDAMKARSRGATLAPASSWSTAPAKRSPSATCSIERSCARPRAMASMTAPRSAAVYGSWRNATSCAARGSSESRTSAVETPSSEVPDISPTARQLVIAGRAPGSPAEGRRPRAARTRPPAAAGVPPRLSRCLFSPSRSRAWPSLPQPRSRPARPRGPPRSTPSRCARRGRAACRSRPSGRPSGCRKRAPCGSWRRW